MGLSLRVLGPLQVCRDDVDVTPSARKERALMALLGMNNGRVVAADRLVDEIWPDLPGSRGRHALHVRIAALRRLLGAAGPGAMIDSVDPGYRFTMAEDDIDACRFDTLVGEARCRSHDGDIAGASLLLREALALWRGDALVDVQLCSSLEAGAAQLEERRRNAQEDLAEAELARGHHGEWVNTLEAMVSGEPFRERRWALLMTALYRCGRQLDALRAFQRARVLFGDAGLEPGPQLQTLEQHIAVHDEALDLRATAAPSPSAEPALGAPRTLTFLFTDIEGSTSRWEVDPEAMSSALALHDEVLRSAIETRGGRLFKHTGDGVCAAFSSARAAIDAAVDAQQRLALPVRMGLASGEVEERDGDYFGPALNRAARVMAAGHGGQVLASLATEELVRDRLPDGVTLVDLGGHPLTGLERPERVFQVCEPSLPTEFPPLRTGRLRTGTLPTPATSFIGRGDELKRLAAELPLRRLITLTGVGGVGKTRLAVAAAWLAADEFPDGVWFCELAPVADPASVAAAVSATLSTRPQVGLSMVDSVVDALGGRRLLLILDNCEHVLDAAADLAGRIVESAPTVSVLATSREPVGVTGERIWLVRSLDPTSEGLELFSDRAADADAAFSPSDDDQTVIAGICERLDGIPLAIELAAARVRTMTVADLAGRLDDRFGFLRGGRRGLARHQTLRATLQWSYRLLDDTERLLFDRLSVFAGGFDLAAAQAVCADERVDRLDMNDVLDGLVDKSMVVADRAGPHVRYRLLETLRQFGEERLDEQAELPGLRDRHLAHYAQLAERTRQRYEGDAHVQGAGVFRVEWDNLRAAMQRAIALGDAARASQILRALYFFGHHDMRAHEIGDWADQFIGSAEATTMIHGVAGSAASWRGDHVEALRQAETGLSMATMATSPGVWLCWIDVEMSHWYSGRTDEASAASRALHDAVDPEREPFAAAMAAAGAMVQACYTDRNAADRYLDRLQHVAALLHNPAIDMLLHWASSYVERADGHFDAALQHLRLALALGEQIGNRWIDGMGRMSLAFLAMASDSATAPVAFEDALTHLYANRDWANMWPALEGLAMHWTKTGRTEPAATLLGHLEAHNIHPANFRRQREEAVAGLGETPEAKSWMARGGALDRDQLVDYALNQLFDATEAAP